MKRATCSMSMFTNLPWSIVTCMAAALTLAGSMSARADEADTKQKTERALNVIFGDAVLQQNISAVRAKAAALTSKERYESLKQWVLPSASRATFRVTGTFSTAHPAPGRDPENLGGELVSPVFDLVNTANEVGQLTALKQQVTEFNPAGNLEQRERAALLFLVEVTGGNLAAAEKLLLEFPAVAAAVDVSSIEQYWPNLLVLSRAAGMPQFGQLVQDLMVDFHGNRMMYFGDAVRDVFLDHVRWLQGLNEFCIAQNTSREELSSTTFPTNWLPVGYWDGTTRGQGRPHALWRTDGEGVHKLGGHEMDYLMFRMPLRGNYQLECDLSTGEHLSTIMVGGTHVEAISTGFKFGNFRKTATVVNLQPPLSHPRDWTRFRAAVHDGYLKQWLNGRVVIERQLPESHDPWIAFRSWRRAQGRVRNIRITGEPVVPESINLSADSNLDGWAPYFEEGFGPARNWRSITTDAGNGIFGRQRPDLPGTWLEKLLRYHRPIFEDGRIDYDFFYSSEKAHVHPAMDRCCFLLHPDGVKIHWVTDAQSDQCGLDPANTIDEADNRRGPKELPLIDESWNHLQLELVADTVRLSLNGQLIYERWLEASNQRTFGLFHYADQTAAKVRNVVWRGTWPRMVPPVEQQQLKGPGTTFLDERRPELTDVFHHSFGDGIPPAFFRVRGDNSAIVQYTDGIQVTRGRTGRVGVDFLQTGLQLQGDFDIEARFRDLSVAQAQNETAGIALVLSLDDEPSHSCGLYRRFQGRNNVGPNNEHRLLFAHKRFNPVGELVYSGRGVGEESTTGRLRLARHGDMVYALYAQDESPYFRITGSEQIKPVEARAINLQLLMQSMRNSTSQVVWQELTVRAEKIEGLLPDADTETK